MTNLNDIVAVSAVRTPLGRFGGALKDVRVYELGAVALADALAKSGFSAPEVDEVLVANCRQTGCGPNPARSAALLAKLPETTPAVTINMACPSGLRTIMSAASSIMTGLGDVYLAGAMDSMSTIPHVVKGLRFKPKKFGDLTIEDGWKDATDPVAETTMGQTAEALAKKWELTREAQDAYALESHRKAVRAQAEGLFARELVPVDLPAAFDHGPVFLDRDETPRADTSREKLASLRPAFSRDGSVTAGNSSVMADGACALVLTTRERALAAGVPPLFSILSYAHAAVNGKTMGEGPQVSIPLALEKAGMQLQDMDLIEVNEAFASQILANELALKWDRDRLNIHGGGIALGHPSGVSGTRITVTLTHALASRDKELGLAAICGAGGVTAAMVIRRES